ncbi:MAG: hypothetical protein ACYDGM_06860 [Vulcanimicrobiaceae bacterium]
MKFQSSLFVAASALVALCAPSLTQASAAAASTPPPSPPPLTAPSTAPATDALPTPSPSAMPAFPTPVITPIPLLPHLSGPAPKPTPTPPVNARKGISGVWEVQIQREDARTQYTHFKLDQLADTLTGEYMDANGKKYPLEGSVDGKHMRVVVSLPDGSTMLFQSTLDGTTDMLGLLTDSKGQIPFTASYRPKENWLENINPGGGLGGIGGVGGSSGLPPQ